MEQPNNINEKIEKKFLQDYRLIISAFLAGSGLLMWIMLYLFNPITTIQKDIALIQQSIDNINTNHETHIQDILQQIKEMRMNDDAQDAKLDTQQQAIIKLLTIHKL